MRLAIFSDIHGNPLALDAVLADIQSQGEVDAYWVLGDFAAIGYDPVTPLEKITALPHASFIRGNTDRYVLTEDLPMPPKLVLEDSALLPEIIEATRSFSWTRGYLSAAGWLDWFTRLPLEVHLTLPDGTRVLGVHASPGRDDGPGIEPWHSDDELEQRMAGCQADVVIVGHTHVPLDRQVGKIRAINLGSVSNPVTPGLQATYVLLDADTQGYRVEWRCVDYDREAVIKAIEQSHHPTPSFLIGLMRGERIKSSDSGWLQAGRRAWCFPLVFRRGIMPTRAEILDTLAASQTQVLAFFQGLSQQNLERPATASEVPGAAPWRAKDHFAHLAKSERNIQQLLRLTLAGETRDVLLRLQYPEGMPMPGILGDLSALTPQEKERLGAAIADVNQTYVNAHHDDSLEMLIADYLAARQETVDLLHQFTDDQLAAPVPTVVSEQAAGDLFAGRAGHAAEHITSIEEGFRQGV